MPYASERTQRNRGMTEHKVKGATGEITAGFGCALSTSHRGIADRLAATGASVPAVRPINLRVVTASVPTRGRGVA